VTSCIFKAFIAHTMGSRIVRHLNQAVTLVNMVHGKITLQHPPAGNKAVMWNHRMMRRPGVVAITYSLLRESGVEVVGVILNLKITQVISFIRHRVRIFPHLTPSLTLKVEDFVCLSRSRC